MHLHRFYVPADKLELTHGLWVNDQALVQQWGKVLRYKKGDELVLFDGQGHDWLYKVDEIEPKAFHLKLITEMSPKLPSRHTVLIWSLLKKDKNDWVVQKATELGIATLVPVVAEHSEKTGFNLDRALKIATEAGEQCGRSNIPHVREPLSLETAIAEFKGQAKLLVCDSEAEAATQLAPTEPVGILIGPEGGWSAAEKELFKVNKLGYLHLGPLTLRAETAAVVAAAKLLTN